MHPDIPKFIGGFGSPNPPDVEFLALGVLFWHHFKPSSPRSQSKVFEVIFHESGLKRIVHFLMHQSSNFVQSENLLTRTGYLPFLSQSWWRGIIFLLLPKLLDPSN